MEDIVALDYVLSVVAFFVVSLCGATIGLVYGLLTALITRATTTVRGERGTVCRRYNVFQIFDKIVFDGFSNILYSN